ncbi:MAG: NUDIX hydrolase [Minisyncoccia bacterium]
MYQVTKTRNAICGIWRKNPKDNDPEVLVVTVTSRDSKGRVISTEVKFPGGGNRIPNEPVIVNLLREVLEETYLIFLPDSAKEIWSREATDGHHTKFGFLVLFEHCYGELRKESFIEDGDEVSPPRFVKLNKLRNLICPAHYRFYRAVCQELYH